MPTGKGQLRIAIEDFLEGFKFGKRIEDSVNSYIRKSVGAKVKVPPPPNLKSEIKMDDFISQIENSMELNDLSPLQGLLVGAGLVLGVVTSLGNSLTQPFGRLWEYAINRIAMPGRFRPEELITIRIKSPDDYDKYKDDGQDAGYDNERMEVYYKLSRQFLTGFEYQVLWRRGILSDDEYHKKLDVLGLRDNDIENLTKLGEVIPPVTDLIMLQVKEAFNDEASNRFKHDEGDTTEVNRWANMQGLSSDWVKRYWRAHWQYPSPQQVFEMVQRLRPGKSDNPVTIDDVREYLKIADYSPFWRDRLLAISYLPFTRVDVRRMYKTKDLDEDGVLNAYMDAGYDLEHAEKLKNFTIHFEAEEETKLSLTTVSTAYSNGSIERQEAETKLTESGYDANSIKFILDNIDYKHQIEINEIKLQNIKKRYIDGVIDETSIYGELRTVNLSQEKIDALIELWTTERNSQVSLPTLAQIEQFYELGIATLDDYKRILRLRGYSDETITWNIQRIDIEKQTKAKKDADDADKEMSKLLLNKESSQYQIDKADIDLAIAQAKAEITDIDVALHGDLDITTSNELTLRKDELKVFISQMNVEKAKLKFDYQSEKDRLSSSPQNEG